MYDDVKVLIILEHSIKNYIRQFYQKHIYSTLLHFYMLQQLPLGHRKQQDKMKTQVSLKLAVWLLANTLI